MELIKKQLDIELKEFNKEEGTIRAVLSSGLPDRQGDMVDQTSWLLDEYRKNPVVLWAHDHSRPAIGQALEIGINSDGMLEALIKFAVKEYDFAKTIFQLYAGKFMRAFSVGFTSGRVDEVNGIKVLRDNTLYEFSAVNVGADALALAKTKGIDVSCFEKKKETKSPACRMADESKEDCVQRKIPEILEENPEMKRDQAVAIASSICSKECESKKSVVPFKDYPTADEGAEWDADAARQRLAKWAGGPDKEEIDWDKYKEGFAWYDAENKENYGSYKLPHHDIIGGNIKTVWRGVVAAMVALLGGRGGVDVDEDEKKSIFNHLAKHYDQFDKEPPEFHKGLIEKEGRVLSTKNRMIIENAKNALIEVLKADEESRARREEKKKINIKRILNRAIRELIMAKKID